MVFPDAFGVGMRMPGALAIAAPSRAGIPQVSARFFSLAPSAERVGMRGAVCPGGLHFIFELGIHAT